MKRMASMIIALVMIVSFTAAQADPFGFSLLDYYGCANSFLPRMGYNAQWEDATESVGTACLTLTFANMTAEHVVYVIGDPVLSIETVFALQLNDTDEEIDAALSEFSQLVNSTAACAWIVHHAADENLNEGLNAAMKNMEAEFTALIAPLLTMDGSFSGTARQEGELMGYPAVFMIELDQASGLFILRMILTPDEAFLETV